ncbi:MAG TPA: hypothetical protein VKM55_06690 [Candidatus Lokiarchaeia archaeon]|nr:hypothetical protein [Candidatus Lokiarchaeia archaeon]
MENENSMETDHVAELIVFSQLIDEGATPVAWYPADVVSVTELTNISLKSISLLVGDKPDKALLNDPRFIVDLKNTFAIIPFPDQARVGMIYMFSYTDVKDQNVVCTITIMVNEEKKFLLDQHEGVEQLLKFTAFEILKLLVRKKKYNKDDITATLWVLQGKLDNLVHK